MMVPYQHNPAEKRRPVAIRKCAAPQITGWAGLGIVIAGNRDAYIQIYTFTRDASRIHANSSLSRARIDSPLLFFPFEARRTVVYFLRRRVFLRSSCDSAPRVLCRKGEKPRKFNRLRSCRARLTWQPMLMQRFRLHRDQCCN